MNYKKVLSSDVAMCFNLRKTKYVICARKKGSNEVLIRCFCNHVNVIVADIMPIKLYMLRILLLWIPNERYIALLLVPFYYTVGNVLKTRYSLDLIIEEA